MKITLLNPFSIMLKKYPLMDVDSKPYYTNGDYRIYKNFDRSFIHTFKNIVIAERVGANKDLLNFVKNDIVPIGEAAKFHDYERPKDAMLLGLSEAKKLNFTVI